MGRRTELALDRDTLLREALILLDERGLEGLSLRALAARLNVQAPAFYWHFKNKAELLGHITALIYREARDSVPACTSWSEWLLGYGRALRQRLADLRDAARLCATYQPLEPTVQLTPEAIASPLNRMGLSQEQGLNAVAAVTSLCIGWGSYDNKGSMHRFLEDIMDFDKNFEISLEALVVGLEQRFRKGG